MQALRQVERRQQMRKIVAGLFVTLDGVTEAPERWQPPYMNQEVGEALAAGMQTADTLLLGRRTYQEWSAYWPTSDLPAAGWINGTPKLVASTTLTSVDWANSELVAGDLAAALAALKQRPGKDILVSGSNTLVGWLLRERLLDELRLLVHPVVVGDGMRLARGADGTRMELVESQAFGNGVVSASYRPAAA
jgi:dihydrofolate reductase